MARATSGRRAVRASHRHVLNPSRVEPDDFRLVAAAMARLRVRDVLLSNTRRTRARYRPLRLLPAAIFEQGGGIGGEHRHRAVRPSGSCPLGAGAMDETRA